MIYEVNVANGRLGLGDGGFNRGRAVHCIHCSIMSNKSTGSSGCKILRVVEDIVVVDTESKGGE